MGKIKHDLLNTGETTIKNESMERKKIKREKAKNKNKLKYEALKITKIENEGPGRFVKKAKSPFDHKQIKGGVEALFQWIDQTKNKIELFDEEEPIFLQLTCVKIPQTPYRLIRFTLKHSLLNDNSEVCLIVSDVGKAKEHEETIEHYQERLQSKGVTNIKTIMPYNQFKNEYGKQFELKRKLLRLHDHFLVDAKVSGYVVHLLGKIFIDSRKLPTPVKLDKPNLKEHIETSLKKSIMKMHSNGDSYLVQIGHSKMKQRDVFENIVEVINLLDCEFPGGEDNIRALWLKTTKSPSVPIFLTLKNRCTVNVTVCHAKRPKNYQEVTGELTTYLHREVTVLPTGEVITHDKKCKNKSKRLKNDAINSNDEENNIKKPKVKKQNKKKQLKLEESNNDDVLDKAEEMYLKEYRKK